jgi:hypothetical protein
MLRHRRGVCIGKNIITGYKRFAMRFACRKRLGKSYVVPRKHAVTDLAISLTVRLVHNRR